MFCSMKARIACLFFILTFTWSSANANTIDPNEILITSNTGYSGYTCSGGTCFDDIFGIGFAFNGSAPNPTTTWSFNQLFDITSASFFGRLGSNAQGAVNDIKLEFFSGYDGAGSLIGSFDPAGFSANQTQNWDLTSLNLVGVGSFTMTMQRRESITSQAVPGAHYEIGNFSLNGSVSAVPVPATFLLFLVPLSLVVSQRLRNKG